MSYQSDTVIVAGHICLDIIPTLLGGAIEFLPGKLVEAGPAITATGGAVSNTGLALHRLGIDTRLMGKVGDDLFGRAVLQIISSHGAALADHMIISPGEATSYTLILSPPHTDRMFIHAPGCNATFNEHDVDTAALQDAQLFHFGYPPLMQGIYHNNGEALTAIFRNVKAAGLTTSLDMAMPDMSGPAGHVDWPELLAQVMPSVDLFLPSIEELLLMLHPSLYERLANEAGDAGIVDRIPSVLITEIGGDLIAMGAKIVAFKCGNRGLYLRTAAPEVLLRMGNAKPRDIPAWSNRELWAPCFIADVVGTTGSGDATIAGFLMGLLRGFTPQQTLTAACAVGACSVEAADAHGGIRDWPQTAARIESGWPRALKGTGSPDWKWDEKNKLWTGPFEGVFKS